MIMAKRKSIKSAKITITFETESSSGGNDFNTVQELADYLKQEPEIAKLVGYTVKIKR
ncbi:unnamed protein product [marine sediment metagenome]|uniref:Uncharacterized protein n=1 Tax=marine sediment metagenome TaxID=412755 RepID=X0V3D8_9ZZZZ